MMKYKLAAVTALSVLMNLAVPQPVANERAICDLERLYWLCTDYQMPVKGYVVEGWFEMPNRLLTADGLEQQLQVKEGAQQQRLADDSVCSANVIRNRGNCYVELQVVTKSIETAKNYHRLWQNFVYGHGISQPIGATILAELPERLDENAMQQWSEELAQSLQAERVAQTTLAQGYQMAGYSPQLSDYLEIDGQKINFNLVFQANENTTVLYLGTPVIYQQY